VEVTEENRDASQEAKGKAMEAISEGTLHLPPLWNHTLLPLGLWPSRSCTTLQSVSL
jgi:hypothetical protein